eukprot:8682706-Pyramimonas_sp.AAC.1
MGVSHGAAEPMVGAHEARANKASVKFPFLDDGPLEVAIYKGSLCIDSPCPFGADDPASFTSNNLAQRMPATKLALSPTLGQPLLH